MPRKKNLAYALVAIVLSGSLVFLQHSGPVFAIRSRVEAVFIPMFQFAGSVKRTVASVADNAANRESGLTGEYQEVASARHTIDSLKQENDRLRAMLAFKEKYKLNLKGVSVLLYGHELGQEYVIIDQGSLAGIRKNDVVLDARGMFIGMVREAGPRESKVGVASNADEVQEAYIRPLGVKAIAKGIGSRTFTVDLVSQDSPVRQGDFVTVRIPGVPDDFLLGEVARVSSNNGGAFKEIQAVLLAHPESETEVFVLMKL